MKLIDADELKNHKVYSDERHEYVVPVYNIDNALEYSKLEVKAGDTVVVKLNSDLDYEEAKYILNATKKIFPNNEVVCISKDTDIVVNSND